MKKTHIKYTFISFSGLIKRHEKKIHHHEYTFNSFLGSLKLNKKDTTEHTFISLSCLLKHEGDTKKKKKKKKRVGFFTIDLFSKWKHQLSHP
jgi:hypothetical protein